jgi:hypothetical protein
MLLCIQEKKVYIIWQSGLKINMYSEVKFEDIY